MIDQNINIQKINKRVPRITPYKLGRDITLDID